jgi:hypothetical protein
MPHRIVCPYCGRTGFVRAERIITAKASMTQYFCGKCLKGWEQVEPPREYLPQRKDRADIA